MLRKLEFYTDGAFSSKTEMGGWASICLEDEMIIDTKTGYEPYSTNNRMELMAMLAAFESADEVETGNSKVIVYTDSAYVANAFNQKWYANWMKNGWKTADKQDVKNQDLWKPLIALYIRLRNRFDLEIIKVESHKNNKWNNYVDALAVKARQKLEF